MVEIRGFRGLRFDAEKTGPLDDVLTPPYDVITEAERQALAGRSAYNMTHLILPESDGNATPYAAAANVMRAWMNDGVLCPDPAPSLYLLRQQFTGPDGKTFERCAFFGLLKLPEPGEHFILGHERTFDKPVADRLALMQATQANLEPIFVMYSDESGTFRESLYAPLATETPLLRARTSDGVTQELWRVPCPPALDAHFENQTLYIADGHHRFKTACTYRDTCRASGGTDAPPQGHDYVMAGFVAFEDPGLKIYAAHRVLPAPYPIDFEAFLYQLRHYFDCKPLDTDAAEAEFTKTDPDACSLVMCVHEHGTWLLTLKEETRQELVGTDRAPAWRALDVAVLHQGILTRLLELPETTALLYEKNARHACTQVESGEAALAFLLRPTKPEQVRACATASEPMPQKATYFYPKLPSGAVMYDFSLLE